MCYRRLLFLAILLAASRLWAGDPRFEKDEVRGTQSQECELMTRSIPSKAFNLQRFRNGF